jgi:2,3-bisphosphoglycerate-dependent phosphoglycerate mutase
MHLFLIRHGQSQNNANPDLSTRVSDPALTEIGQRQAETLAEYIEEHQQHFGFTHLYASPMLRALQTAAPIARRLNMPVHVWPDICEFGGVYLDSEGHPQGIAQPGLTRSTILEHFPFAQLPDSITDNGWWTMVTQRESFSHAVMRVVRVHEALAARITQGERIALVSHGMFIDSLLKALLHKLPTSPEQLYFMHGNTAVTHVQLEARAGEYYTEMMFHYINNRIHLPADLWTA